MEKKQRFLQIGVELEGGWEENPKTVAQRVVDAKYKHDGTVRTTAAYQGEIVTRPHRSVETLEKDVAILYPSAVNDTCGFHIHESFNALDTSFLTSPKFWTHFLEFWEKWGKENKSEMTREDWHRFSYRLDGKRFANMERCYAERKFIPESQLTFRDDRYTMVNFIAYSKYKTVEMRLLPMFTEVSMAIKAIKATVEMYESFLNGFEFEPIELQHDLQQKDNGYFEEIKVKQPSFKESTEDFKFKTKGVVTGENVFYAIEGAHEYMLPWKTKLPGSNL